MRVRQHPESGIALPMVIALMVVALAIMLAITLMTQAIRQRGTASSKQSLAQAPVDDAADAWLRALQSRLVGEHDGYEMTAAEARSLMGSDPHVVILRNSSLPGNLGRVDATGATAVPVQSRFTVRHDLGNGSYSYWQLFSLGRPDWRQPATVAGLSSTTGSRVVTYFRGWIGDERNQSITNSRIVRAEYRPGRFADYEMIVDGLLVMRATGGGRVTINGPVHSNGLNDQLFGQSLAASTPRIQAQTGTHCRPGAQFSTTSGAVSLAGSGGCSTSTIRRDTGKIINLKTLDATSEWAWSMLCHNSSGTFRSSDHSFAIRCVRRSAAGSLGRQNLASLATMAPSTVLLVDGDVHVTGNVPSGRRVSVIAHSRTTAGVGGNNIFIDHNVTHGTGASVGLFAGGDIIVGIQGCPVSTIQSAMIAASGTISFPAQWRIPFITASMQPFLPRCPQLTIFGSIASHYMPILNGDSGGATVLGWSTRNLTYDRNLYNAPPPLVPQSAAWQQDGYDEANKRCFTATGHLSGGPGCR